MDLMLHGSSLGQSQSHVKERDRFLLLKHQGTFQSAFHLLISSSRTHKVNMLSKKLLFEGELFYQLSSLMWNVSEFSFIASVVTHPLHWRSLSSLVSSLPRILCYSSLVSLLASLLVHGMPSFGAAVSVDSWTSVHTSARAALGFVSAQHIEPLRIWASMR